MDLEPEYQRTLDYLYSFVDFSLTHSSRYSAENFDLERMRRLIRQLGSPQDSYPVLHVAGTKGKGSVAAFLSSALRAQGYRVGLYTSPHLHDYAERIQINDESIPHADLVSLVDELKPQFEAIVQLTTFEITTALAMEYFRRQAVDVAVFEVGLGGRLDATNVVTPVVSVITSLSYDHMSLLGNTLAEIAGEKAGIIKPGVPVVTSPQVPEALEVIQKIAGERKSPLAQVGKDYLFEPLSHELAEQRFLIWNGEQQGTALGNFEAFEDELTIPLLGRHQVENAATAYTALLVFRSRSLPVSQGAIRSGFASAVWPGRFEILSKMPALVVDSAHNPDSALKLRQTLDEYFPDQPVIFIVGASEDKDIQGIMKELMPRVEEVIATKSFHPRAIDPQRLVEQAERFGKPVQIIPDVPEALEAALQRAGNQKLVLAAGSIFIVAGIREAWLARKRSILNV